MKYENTTIQIELEYNKRTADAIDKYKIAKKYPEIIKPRNAPNNSNFFLSYFKRVRVNFFDDIIKIKTQIAATKTRKKERL